MDETERRWLAARVREHRASIDAAKAADDEHWERVYRRERRRCLSRLQEMHGWGSNAIHPEDEV